MKAAGALKESDYTADSWKVLQSALAEADTALKEKKDQDTVDKATEKLNKAISALVKKDAGQKVSGTNGTTGTSGKSGKTGSTSNTKSGKAAKTGRSIKHVCVVRTCSNISRSRNRRILT